MEQLSGLRKKQNPIILFILLISLWLPAGADDDSQYFEENYIKTEHRIPMRDGVTLFTAVYSPMDTSQKYPILMRRSPYSAGLYGTGKDKYLKWRRSSIDHLIKEGYILVFQDVRGRFMSEGEYINMRPYIPDKKNASQVDESSDTYDTVDWLVKNIPNNNGKVGIWGISYPGFYAAMSAIDAHPALKAVSPQAPISDWFSSDDFHHNGAFSLVPAVPFFHAFGRVHEGLYKTWPQDFNFPTNDAYTFYLELGPIKNINERYFHNKIPFWNEIMKHGTKDNFWKSRNNRPYLRNIKPAVMVVGGFFDAENAYGAMATYRAIESQNPKANNCLVLGPWIHGGWVRTDGSHLGDIDFGSETGHFYVKNIELPFFNYYLKGKGKLDLPEAFVFETGTNRWHRYKQWPPENAAPKKLFLAPGKSLTFQSPDSEKVQYDEYISDPANPVPYTATHDTNYPKHFMVEDQRFVADRPDVLVYSTNALSENVTIAGPIEADIYVSTTGTDSDWIVKVIDVYPEDSGTMSGYQMLLRAEIMRGKFRNGLEKTEPMEPQKITHIKFSLVDVHHTFKKGHKIMVQIQSSWFPIFDRNPQKYVDIYNASEENFQKATQRVYFSKQHPSGIVCLVL
jgi:putative CocE/NonD family hydrolase